MKKFSKLTIITIMGLTLAGCSNNARLKDDDPQQKIEKRDIGVSKADIEGPDPEVRTLRERYNIRKLTAPYTKHGNESKSKSEFFNMMDEMLNQLNKGGFNSQKFANKYLYSDSNLLDQITPNVMLAYKGGWTWTDYMLTEYDNDKNTQQFSVALRSSDGEELLFTSGIYYPKYGQFVFKDLEQNGNYTKKRKEIEGKFKHQ